MEAGLGLKSHPTDRMCAVCVIHLYFKDVIHLHFNKETFFINIHF